MEKVSAASSLLHFCSSILSGLDERDVFPRLLPPLPKYS